MRKGYDKNRRNKNDAKKRCKKAMQKSDAAASLCRCSMLMSTCAPAENSSKGSERVGQVPHEGLKPERVAISERHHEWA